MTLQTLKKILDVLDKIYHLLINHIEPVNTEKENKNE